MWSQNNPSDSPGVHSLLHFQVILWCVGSDSNDGNASTTYHAGVEGNTNNTGNAGIVGVVGNGYAGNVVMMVYRYNNIVMLVMGKMLVLELMQVKLEIQVIRWWCWLGC